MAVSPTVRINVSGARGESFGDIARRTGAYDVAPTDSDAIVLDKFADFAIEENPGFQGEKGDPGSPGEGYATRSALATAGNTATNGDDAYLTEAGREGKFIFRTGDLSAQVSADPGQGLYIAKASAASGASGAWVRQFTGGIRPEWFGALGDGASDDTLAYTRSRDAAARRGVEQTIELTGQYLVSDYVNQLGIVTTGPGRIVVAVTGGVQQVTTYADFPGRYVYGREYLHRVFQRIAIGNAGPSSQIGSHGYGDSTMANGYMSMSTADLLLRLFQTRGVGNISFTNHGVAGTQVSALNWTADDATTNDLSIVKYGINDGGNPESTRLDTFQAELEAKVAARRAQTNGGVANHSILLVGPNCTADTPNGRDERWYEQLRGVYLYVARKYKCAYLDTYAMFKDARGGTNLWLDEYGVHPRNSLGLKIWSAVADAIITREEASWFGTSNFTNITSASFAPSNGANPSGWPLGIAHARATTGNGFPVDGFIVSERHPEGGCIQRLYPYAPFNSRMLVRTAYVGADLFNRWTGAPEGLTLVNGWTAFDASFGANVTAAVDVSGNVMIEGAIEGGVTTAGTVITQLPEGMRPPVQRLFLCPADAGATVQIKIEPTGNIVLQTAGNATLTSLSGIQFLAA